MIRVLIFFPNIFANGGMENYIMNFHRFIDKTLIQFDYIFPLGKGLYEDEILALGGKIYHIDMSKKSIGYYKKTFKQFVRDGYKIIHFHTDDFALNAMIGAKLAGFKNVIAHSHNNKSCYCGAFKSKIKNKIISLTCNYHLAVSDEAGEWLFGKNNYSLIFAGIKPDKYLFSSKKRNEVRQKYGINNDDIVIGCVGHFLETHKNQTFLLKVLQNLQTNFPNTKLIFVGGGIDENVVRTRTIEYGLNGVIFAGAVDASEFYSSFDVFSLPSLHEGLGLACVEAIINGLICVNSSNVPMAKGLEKYEKRLLLSDDLNDWSKTMLEAVNSRKHSCPEEFYTSNFYYEVAVQNLRKFYLSLENKTNDKK